MCGKPIYPQKREVCKPIGMRRPPLGLCGDGQERVFSYDDAKVAKILIIATDELILQINSKYGSAGYNTSGGKLGNVA